jgi:hypothetical protein
VPVSFRGDRVIVGADLACTARARSTSRLRRLTARLTGFTFVPFEPVLRDGSAGPARCHAWLRDQYQHPVEHCHTIAEVQRRFSENRVEYLRTYPSAVRRA